jgi:phosphopantothenoylcysteine decarboxylase/phosphopantothenate--cysteine ligase
MSIKIIRDKRILLGITGSIACYKSIDLASKLTQAGAAVDVILTESAMKFIEPLSLSSVTGRPAYWDMWGLEDHILHVKLAESADLIIIAPATAHTIAKLAHGLADNLLTVSILAARTPLILAPAMDAGMYEHPATSENISILNCRNRGPNRRTYRSRTLSNQSIFWATGFCHGPSRARCGS